MDDFDLPEVLNRELFNTYDRLRRLVVGRFREQVILVGLIDPDLTYTYMMLEAKRGCRR